MVDNKYPSIAVDPQGFVYIFPFMVHHVTITSAERTMTTSLFQSIASSLDVRKENCKMEIFVFSSLLRQTPFLSTI